MANHGEHVYTVELAPGTPIPTFKPGQFLHLTLDEYDPARHWPESRVFSIASSPRELNRVRILYSVIGPYTRRMERELRAGGAVWIKLPYGEFVVDSSQDVVLVAGGTGISAYTAFLEGLKADHDRKVLLVYGARNPELLIYRKTLLGLLARIRSLSAILFAEQAPPAFESEQGPAQERLRHRIGRISVEGVWPLLEQPLNRVYYLSGPPQMLMSLSSVLRERGLPSENVCTDAWE